MKRKLDKDHVLVYSTDPIILQQAQGKLAEASPSVAHLKPAVRIERKGRAGKSVTVLFKLPAHQTFLNSLVSYLKKTLGSGGTSYIKDSEGIVEIQGEHQKTILDLVKKFKWPA